MGGMILSLVLDVLRFSGCFPAAHLPEKVTSVSCMNKYSCEGSRFSAFSMWTSFPGSNTYTLRLTCLIRNQHVVTAVALSIFSLKLVHSGSLEARNLPERIHNPATGSSDYSLSGLEALINSLIITTLCAKPLIIWV